VASSILVCDLPDLTVIGDDERRVALEVDRGWQIERVAC